VARSKTSSKRLASDGNEGLAARFEETAVGVKVEEGLDAGQRNLIIASRSLRSANRSRIA
jgi:hypothetical protein